MRAVLRLEQNPSLVQLQRSEESPEANHWMFPKIGGNHWLISPDHKALCLGGGTWPGGGRLTSHDIWVLNPK